MKRFLFLVIGAAVAAALILFALRSAHSKSSAALFAILPADMLAVAVVPDVNAARAAWRRTDLYAIWLEPAVQEFLQKPRAKVPKAAVVRETLDQLEGLGATNAFIGVTAAGANGGKIVAGFQLKKKTADAEKILDSWRTRLTTEAGDATRVTSDYRTHRIETDASGNVSVSTCSAGDWILAANDNEDLKEMLDRVDGDAKAAGANLAGDALFAAACKQMPTNYAALIYGRPDRLATLLPMPPGFGGAALSAVAEVRSISGALWFDAGKIHDRIFVRMPKKIDGSLARSSLALGSNDTFLYFTSLADLSAIVENGDGPAALARFAKPLTDALASSGITPADWKAAFGSEFSIVGEWAQDSRLPSVVAVVPVRDAARAQQLSANLSRAAGTSGLRARQKEGVTYYTAATTGQLFSLAPTMAISDRVFAFGFDSASVELAVSRATRGATGLAAIPDFTTAQNMVPTAQASFAYVNPALLYRRFDAAVRPVLLMGAAFVPGINDTVDLGKFPEPEAITKHLSPIAMSQRYVDGGYLAESAGPATMNGLLAGAAGVIGSGTALFRQQFHGGGAWSGHSNFVPRATSSPSPMPRPTP